VQFYFWADAPLRGNEFYPTIFLLQTYGAFGSWESEALGMT
jgi:hypothetical protein